MSANRWKTWGVVVACALALAACGGSPSGSAASHPPGSSTTTSAPITVKAAAQEYTSDVAPALRAMSAFQTAASAWGNQTTQAQMVADARPLIDALQTVDQKLTDGTWPQVAQQDIHTLVSDVAPLVGDLQGLSTLNLLDVSTWESQLQRDASIEHTQADVVRHDLGLPPLSSG